MENSIKVQASCLILRDNKIAMIRKINNPSSGTYMRLIPPGGHVEFGETLEEAVIREVREETGLIIKNPKNRGVITFLSHVEEASYHAVCFYFVATDVEGELQNNEPDKLIPQWVDLGGVEDNLEVPSNHRAFIRYVLGDEQRMLNARVEWSGPKQRDGWTKKWEIL